MRFSWCAGFAMRLSAPQDDLVLIGVEPRRFRARPSLHQAVFAPVVREPEKVPELVRQGVRAGSLSADDHEVLSVRAPVNARDEDARSRLVRESVDDKDMNLVARRPTAERVSIGDQQDVPRRQSLDDDGPRMHRQDGVHTLERSLKPRVWRGGLEVNVQVHLGRDLLSARRGEPRAQAQRHKDRRHSSSLPRVQRT